MERPVIALVLITLLAPLMSFAGICLPRKSQQAFSVLMMSIATLAALGLFINQWNISNDPVRIAWFAVGTLSFDADLIVSNQSLLMLVVVAFISLLVHIYSTTYMKDDSGQKRYFAMLGFFTFAMQGIVLSDNLLMLFIFWELVGFSSYMLIGHWTEKVSAGRAATKAFIINRIGDVGFLIGLMILWAGHGTFSVSAISDAGALPGWQTAAALLVFCGVIGKSAQFPLFPWLPDAMEGPTPVSALIHAATMVAAGVYLLIRVFSLFTPDALMVVAIIGMITTLAGALAAIAQFDIKKILAYSTMSQLGLMILALGAGAVDAALLHLLTHAFFKACLFLAAGSVIHSLHVAHETESHVDAQDIRMMGGMRKSLPVTSLAFVIAGASLAGLPFSSGFLSKEAILSALVLDGRTSSLLMFGVVAVVSFLTILYTFRMIWHVFFGESRTPHTSGISESSWSMRVPLVILAVCSLWFVVSPNPLALGGVAIPVWVTIFSVVWVGAALAAAWLLFRQPEFRTFPVLLNAFYIDQLYSTWSTAAVRVSTKAVTVIDRRVIDGSIHAFAYAQIIFAHVIGWIDKTIVDGTVNAIAKLTGLGGKIARSFQGGNIQLYIFWSVFAIIIFIIWLIK